MTNPSTPAEQAIASFSREHYLLGADLEALDRVHAANAPEAAVFYAGRILEVLAAQAVEDLDLPPHGTLLANLDLLEQYALVPVTARYCAHALRRLANDARHVVRAIAPADAELARLFVGLAVEWYFRLYPFGPRAAGEAVPTVAVLHELLAACGSADGMTLLGRVAADSRLSQTPAVPAVLVEALLDGGRLAPARVILNESLMKFPGDARLTLLHGLHLSRSDDLEGAAAVLEPLRARYATDPEAAGILAGVYKRLWQQEPGGMERLKRSFDTYLSGWKASRETSAYLGANASATALWLGRAELSRELARTLLDLVTARMSRLARRIADPEAGMGFWHAATLAELRLLVGEVEAARMAYGRLFARHADKRGNIDVARRQAEAILHHAGGADAATFFTPL